MSSVIGFAVWLLVSVVAFSAFLSAVLAIALGGYFLLRVLLKVMGLHTAAPGQLGKEWKAAAIVGGFALATIAVFALIEWIGIATGAID